MRTALAAFAGLGACVLLALLAGGCSSEEIILQLKAGAAPNPVDGVAVEGGKRWDYQVTIANPTRVGVVVEYYHTAVDRTDTGYAQKLQVVRVSQAVGLRIEPGASAGYPANRFSNGEFSRGRERRVYHALGDDGVYYSGEVLVDLR